MMAGETDSEMKTLPEHDINIDNYRNLVRTYIDLHLYSAAQFWADKVVSLSNGEPRDVYWLAQCMYHMKQYHRAAHIIRSRGLEKTHMLCFYLAVRSLLAAWELNEALQVLNENEANTTLHSTVGLESSVLFLKGRVFESLENRGIAADYYKQALRTDVHCYEAFEALVQHQMLSASEENELLESLPISEQCSGSERQLLHLLYQSKLKKYHAPCEDPSTLPLPLSQLSNNLDLAVSQAERAYYNCNYQLCGDITDAVLKKDPYHYECLPVHIGCLGELRKESKLFYLAHKMVDLGPDMAISWFAVGVYYYVIGRSDPARRFLGKATTMDKLFGPAWLAYGHSFAAENEHDQAMAAYFKSSQLMKGCHLPLLYIGLEYGLTNNIKLADKFFQQALTIAPNDPFVIHEMGVIAFQNQDYEEAERHFEDALKKVQTINEPVLAEKWEALLNNLGHTCRKLHKYPKALDYHRQALVLSPMNASTYSAMGYVQALMGKTSDACDTFHKALGINRDDTFSTTMLSYVVEQLIEETPAFIGAPHGVPDIRDLETPPANDTRMTRQSDVSNIDSPRTLSIEVEMADSSNTED
uniref:Cell division cycle protein 16 homolog n=1 Tax=Timema genevievae TaxID=629358 RepID=A0A7R9PJV3_TIMGE|nr:unnamed protein product [Timema genevievae]